MDRLGGAPAPAGGRASDPVAWLLAALLLAGYGIWGARALARDKPVDFYAYYTGAAAMRRGEVVYGPTRLRAVAFGVPVKAPPFVYAPPLAALVGPLASLPARPAAAIWLGVSAVALVTAAWWLGTALGGGAARRVTLLLLAGSVPALAGLQLGQVGSLLLLAVAAPLRFRRLRAGGWVLLGVSVALKPLAWGCVAQAAWQRRGRALLGLAAGGVAAVVMSVLVGGVEPWRQYFALLPSLSAELPSGDAPNQSLYAFFIRLFAPADVAAHNAPVSGAAGTAAVVAAGVLLAATLWLTRRRLPEREARDYGLWLLAGMLITPRSWSHHMVLALVPIAVLALSAWRGRVRGTLLLCALAYLLMDGQAVLWHVLASRMLLLSLGTYGLVLVWALLAFAWPSGETAPAR